jgi:hypothetical protein
MRKIFLLIVLLQFTSIFTSLAQRSLPSIYWSCTPVPDNCNHDTITIPNVLNLCPGSTYTFTPSVHYAVEDVSTPTSYSVTLTPATFAFQSYSWSPTGITPSSGTTDPSSLSFSVAAPAISASEVYSLTVFSIGPNIINKGDFQQYDTTSTTTNPGYEYSCMASTFGDGTGTNGCHDGHIKWGNSHSMCYSGCPLFTTLTTEGSYNTMLVVNASTTPPPSSLFIPYFWGQYVSMCPGQKYRMTYWFRRWRPCLDCTPTEDHRPLINVMLGQIDSLPYGISYYDFLLDSTRGGSTSNSCDTNWYEVSFDFNNPYSGDAFICMYNSEYNSGGAQFCIDNISLQRVDSTVKAVTFGTVGPPSPTVTSNPSACENMPFTFTVHGPAFDTVFYNITGADATITSQGAINAAGALVVTVPGTAISSAGTLCFNITKVDVPCHSGSDDFTMSPIISTCVPINGPPSGGVITGPDYKCGSDSAFTVSDSGVTGTTSFHWYASGDGGIISSSITTATVSVAPTDYTWATNILYVASNSCGTDTLRKTVTINGNPYSAPLTSSTLICTGTTVAETGTYWGPTFGYTWSSSNTTIATIDVSGNVTGISPGSDTISYIITGPAPTYCSTKVIESVTIAPTPSVASFTGDPSICPGSSDTLTVTSVYSGSTTPTYFWYLPASSCSTCAYAIVSPTVSPTVYRVKEGLGACYTPIESFTVTIKPEPTLPVVSGPSSICPGFATTLTATATAGTVTPTFQWGPSASLSCTNCNPTYASPPTTTVYSVAATALGCTGPSRNYTVTVNPVPVITAVSSATVCIGSPVVMSATVTAATHVIWEDSTGTEISGALVFTFTPTVTGNNIYKIIATNDYGCADTATTIITVNPYPSAPYINGPTNICPGDSVHIIATSPYSGTGTLSYTWAESAGLSCTVCDPTVASPTVTTVYTVYATAFGCAGPPAIDTVIVYSAPAILSISGDTVVCAGTVVTDTFSATDTGATSFAWTGPGDFYSSTLTTIATLTPTVTGIYTLTASNEHCSVQDTISVSAIFTPSMPYLINDGRFSTQSDTVCSGTPFTLYVRDTFAGDSSTLRYYWSPSTGVSCATCDPVTITPYTSTVYSVYATASGCPSSVLTVTVTIGAALPAPVLSGDSVICSGSTTTITASYSGTVAPTYNWYPPGSGCATCTSITVTPTVTTTYALIVTDTPSYCGSGAVMTVTVVPAITPTVTGSSTVCQYNTILLTGSPGGGTWSSTSSSIATIDPASGTLAAIDSGVAMITYTYYNSDTLCSTPTIAVFTVTVLPSAYPGQIVGSSTGCAMTVEYVYDSVAGGTWSTNNPSIALVDEYGDVNVISTGTVIISYSVPSGSCTSVATDTLVVTPPPTVPPITGINTICITGSTTLTDSIPGGSWFSYNTDIAMVDPVSGLVTPSGGSTGIAIIAYDVSNDCGTTEVLDTVAIISSGLPVTGNLSICTGSTSTLSNGITGGTWSTSDPTIATIDPSTGLLGGVATGTVSVVYNSPGGPCGPFIDTVTALINMPPFITSNFTVACQSLSGSGDINHLRYILTDSSGCIKVCDSTIMRYYANGYAGSTLNWTVTGGTILTNYGDSIDVLWPVAGTTGSISLNDTLSACMGSTTICISVIQKPHANFSPTDTRVCLESPVNFTDLSTADPLSPIVSWYWDFGDGTFSSVENPAHIYSSGGRYTPMLIVANACGCTDTFRTVIKVSTTAGPYISCPSIVCDRQQATYTIPDDGCSPNYTWSATDGTILSGQGTPTVTVVWNHVDSNGAGFLSVIDPCSVCSDATMIKIPVILSNASIAGPDVICQGQEYQYRFPLWPGTQYEWGVLGDPSAIVDFRNDYKLIVNFSAIGTYTIHGRYENQLALCGGNADKTITVKPFYSIIGRTTVCRNEPTDYTLPGISAVWTLSDTSGSVISTSTCINFSYTFITPGLYFLSASGPICSDPITINVLPTPAALDSVKGPDTVCLNRLYTYTAFSNVPGTTYNWEITGGTVIPSSGSATVSVVWNGSVPMQLSVARMNTTAPFCQGVPTVLNIVPEVINPIFTGDEIPCANSQHHYNTTYTRGEVYDWAIYPDSLGSVISGDHTPNANILWNNFPELTPQMAIIVLTVHKCDTSISDSLTVNVQPDPGVEIIPGANPACPTTPVTFTSAPGGSSYTWDFGDGSPIVTTSTYMVTHSFPANTSSFYFNYVVRVTVSPDTSALCPISGIAVINEHVLPGPVANASSGSKQVCDDISATLTATATDNDGALTYAWFNGGSSAGSGEHLTVTLPGDYTFVVTGGNGCSDTSNMIVLTACAGGGDSVCHHGVTTVSSVSCNTISVAVTSPYGSSPSWNAVTSPVGPAHIVGSSASYTYTVPGIYIFDFNANYSPTCLSQAEIVDSIGAIPNFIYQLACADGGVDSVFLVDNTAYLPGWTLTSIVWSGDVTGTGAIYITTLSAPGTYNVHEDVTYQSPSGTSYTCGVDHTITLPSMPAVHAGFTASTVDVCSGIPITFTPTAPTGIINFHWDFGDSATSVLDTVQRTYTYSGPSPFKIYTVSLTVTDGIGCTADSSKIITIHANRLEGGTLPGSTTVCSSDAPVNLIYHPDPGSSSAISYLWSTGSTVSTISVDSTGAYWVTVNDVYQCQRTFPDHATNIDIIKIPPALISGRFNYCLGETVNLSTFSGSGVNYQWYQNGTNDGTANSVSDAGLAAGGYQYMLVQTLLDSAGTVLCSDTATDSIYIHPTPHAPGISGPTVVDCSTYHLQLAASEDGPGTFNWSNGTTGNVADIYTGGLYEVWFTDANGCKDSATQYVDYSPDYYFQYFPSGCYTICSEQLPLMLYGPPNAVFHPWAWADDSVIVSSGEGLMSAYTITGAGTYNWGLSNGLCTDTSQPLDLSVVPCVNCGNGPLGAKLACDPSSPGSFTLNASFFSPAIGTTYVIGTDIGPIVPFSGTLSTAGLCYLTATFTSLSIPLPPTVQVEIEFTLPDGSHCFQKVSTKPPACTWESERSAGGDTTSITGGQSISVSNSMLVFPNPTAGQLNISYDYGADAYKKRTLTIYDNMGRKTDQTIPNDIRGSWSLNTANWSPGIYIIRMEADGQPLQTQQVVVTH